MQNCKNKKIKRTREIIYIKEIVEKEFPGDNKIIIKKNNRYIKFIILGTFLILCLCIIKSGDCSKLKIIENISEIFLRITI